MYKADREVRPIFFNKTHYLHCTASRRTKRYKLSRTSLGLDLSFRDVQIKNKTEKYILNNAWS